MPATAFTVARTHQITAALNELYVRVKVQNPIKFTHEEMYELFIEEEHLNMLQHVSNLVGLGGGSVPTIPHADAETGVILRINVHLFESGKKKPLPFPRYVIDNPQFAKTAGQEVKDKWCAWNNYTAKAIRDFGQLHGLFLYLNSACRVPAQVRYVWPGVLNLIGMDETAQEYIDKLRPLKVPAGMPSFSKELREYAARTAGRIAQATLLPAFEPSSVTSEVTLVSNYNTPPRVKCPEGFPSSSIC